MIRPLSCLLFCTLLALPGCSREQGTAPAPAEAATAADFERGPHRGRLLRDGDFALELQIFESGVPPEFHAYLFREGQALAPDAAQVSVELTRLDGRVDRFAFAPQGDFLRGNGTVVEPHSFSVQVSANVSGKTHRWRFDSFEGRTAIPAATAAQAGVRSERAGPALIADTLALSGRIVPNAEYVRTVAARYPGLVRSVPKSVGAQVAHGETLAVVESNESLQSYAVTAPIDGVIVERHANPGEVADQNALFVVADHRQLWAELALFPRDLPRVRTGQSVRLASVDGVAQGEGAIVGIAPTEGERHGSLSGTYTVRVKLDNRAMQWTPGLFVNAGVRVAETQVPLAVRRSGLQAFRDFTVVFEQIGDTYEVRMLELGRQDETYVEVLGGLEAGVSYVAENSFLIKADIEKSGASHDH